MSHAVDGISYVYIKNGDVAAQLLRIMKADTSECTSGPDAFLTDFLHKTGVSPVLLIGQGQENTALQINNVRAKVLGGWSSTLGKVFSRSYNNIAAFVTILRFRPERLICGRTGGMFWACYVVSQIYSIPLIHSRHNRLPSGSDPWYTQIRSAIDNWCMRRAAGVICHGPYLRQQLVTGGVPEARIFEFDVNFNDMLTQGNEDSHILRYPELAGKWLVLYLGRIESSKGIFDLLDACSERLKEDSNFVLLYAGTGSQKQALEREVLDRGLDSKVMLLGEVPHHALVDILSISKVVVTPTRSEFPEGRCMAAMESLIMGVPVIAPDFGPFPFLVRHGENGLLFKPGDAEDLHVAIKSLLDDDGLYSKLRAGALKSGKKLLSPPLTFGQAVERAFMRACESKP